jgi:hypothetical protein
MLYAIKQHSWKHRNLKEKLLNVMPNLHISTQESKFSRVNWMKVVINIMELPKGGIRVKEAGQHEQHAETASHWCYSRWHGVLPSYKRLSMQGI